MLQFGVSESVRFPYGLSPSPFALRSTYLAINLSFLVSYMSEAAKW